MAYKNLISESDSQILDDLTIKLDERKREREYMKDVNLYYRKYGTCKGYPNMLESVSAELDERVVNTHSWEKYPFSNWAINNNDIVIKHLENSIEKIILNCRSTGRRKNAGTKSRRGIKKREE